MVGEILLVLLIHKQRVQAVNLQNDMGCLFLRDATLNSCFEHCTASI